MAKILEDISRTFNEFLLLPNFIQHFLLHLLLYN